MTQQSDNDDDDIIFLDGDYNIAANVAYELNKDDDEKEHVDLNGFIFDDELRAIFANCSLDGDDHVQIPGLREQHVRRYLTDGKTTDAQRRKLNKSKYIVRQGGVKKIKSLHGNKISATQLVIIYEVEIEFEGGCFARGFTSTRDIKSTNVHVKVNLGNHILVLYYIQLQILSKHTTRSENEHPQYKYSTSA